jgi:predicted ATPase with chaperone activity
VKGVLSIALEAKRRCRQTLIVPLENAAEAAVVEGVSFYAICSISQVVHFLRGDIALELVRSTNGWSEVGAALSKSPLPAYITFSPLDLFLLLVGTH